MRPQAALLSMKPADHPGTTRSPGTGGVRFACRFCAAPLSTTFVDLGMSPLCQTHIAPDQLHEMEPFYPLHAYVCDDCLLVQLQEFVSPDEIFTEYAYFSSYSYELGGACAPLRRTGRGALRAGRKQQGDGDREQRRLSAAALRRRAACRCWASSRPPTLRKVAVDKGIPTTVRFFGARPQPPRSRASTVGPICCSGTTCSPTCRT